MRHPKLRVTKSRLTRSEKTYKCVTDSDQVWMKSVFLGHSTLFRGLGTSLAPFCCVYHGAKMTAKKIRVLHGASTEQHSMIAFIHGNDLVFLVLCMSTPSWLLPHPTICFNLFSVATGHQRHLLQSNSHDGKKHKITFVSSTHRSSRSFQIIAKPQSLLLLSQSSPPNRFLSPDEVRFLAPSITSHFPFIFWSHLTSRAFDFFCAALPPPAPPARLFYAFRSVFSLQKRLAIWSLFYPIETRDKHVTGGGLLMVSYRAQRAVSVWARSWQNFCLRSNRVEQLACR